MSPAPNPESSIGRHGPPGQSLAATAAALWTMLQSAPVAGAPPAPALTPFDTSLAGAATPVAVPDEHVTVSGRRWRPAPGPGYADEVAPWEGGRAIRDPRTGASTTAFGNAYNLGSPLGSDERSSETGGIYVAPRHP